jgi:hypothetical protein
MLTPTEKGYAFIFFLLWASLLNSCSREHRMTKHQQMTQTEMKAFGEKCFAELEAKQKVLLPKYKIGTYDLYWYSQEEGTLQFEKNKRVLLRFDVIFLGTWAKYKDDWLWAWANPSMIETVRDKAKVVQDLGSQTGHPAFKTSQMTCDEHQAWELAGMSLHVLNGIGIYRCPSDRVDLFLALMKEHN